MQVKLYNNKSDKRYVNKTITLIDTLSNVYLKDETEVINPSIILQSIPDNVNYCEIIEFNRYYYLESVDYINGQVATNWHVDVLMSFMDALQNQECIVKRNATIYDMYLKDDETMLEAYTKTRVKEFPNGFDSSTQQFVLAVVGNTTNTNSGSGGSSST